ncbi:MAG: hypothetical protein L6R40_000132 [Gallowayella cf. fulva]|nr:MAG: hypothetical protein L6R40_000132 [Xanthomendoza cf. fulva]
MSPTSIGISHSLPKRHSSPSLRAQTSSRAPVPIEQDPFPYFVSPIFEEEDDTENELTAGIMGRCRSVSTPNLAHKPTHKYLLPERAMFQATKLKLWIKKMEASHFHSSSPTLVVAPIPPPQAPITLEDLPPIQRGRDIHFTATSRVRTKVRTPSRKPRAWRRPSDNIWPVEEEPEGSGAVGLDVKT